MLPRSQKAPFLGLAEHWHQLAGPGPPPRITDSVDLECGLACVEDGENSAGERQG